MFILNILIKGIQSEKKLLLLIDFNRVETFGLLFFFKKEGFIASTLGDTRSRLGSHGVILVGHWYIDASIFDRQDFISDQKISGVIRFPIFFNFLNEKRHSVHHSILTKESKNALQPEKSYHLEVKKKSPYKELESSRLVFIHSLTLMSSLVCLHVSILSLLRFLLCLHERMSSPFYEGTCGLLQFSWRR